MSNYYVHGTSVVEQARLSQLNDVINVRSLRALGLEAGQRVLEIGSGLGQFARAMARAVQPGGRVVAVERSDEQLANARRLAQADGEATLVDWRLGDAVRPPLGDSELGAFDVAHARFLLEHVTDPGAVVRAMVGALAPGGRIMLEDDDHDLLRLHPEPEGVLAAWQAYVESYRRAGHDPFVGRRLVELIRDAGAQPVRNDFLFFGACSGAPDFEPLVDNMIGILEGARAEIVVTLPECDFDRALTALRAWQRREDAALWYAISFAEGRRD